ncbi:hypothetical protein BpHYR1_034103 [Brachionus plicatilis]|uniref:Zinc finger CCCH-type TRM13 domain-containing protein n=1 Tax=Brachionus plicatilis TaxID=10195 RepID=A0A3M7PJZ9_BRAPC|nr:hypothetical protein BpHYR1_034103 [Brachionus plicatilis]
MNEQNDAQKNTTGSGCRSGCGSGGTTRICKHICQKKKRQCKLSALKNTDFCVEHLAFNNQVITPNPT